MQQWQLQHKRKNQISRNVDSVSRIRPKLRRAPCGINEFLVLRLTDKNRNKLKREREQERGKQREREMESKGRAKEGYFSACVFRSDFNCDFPADWLMGWAAFQVVAIAIAIVFVIPVAFSFFLLLLPLSIANWSFGQLIRFTHLGGVRKMQ